ncbi:P-loop containing nucleoside triphosphate hydrolase protein, partial [Aureobasidium melanogenum]
MADPYIKLEQSPITEHAPRVFNNSAPSDTSSYTTSDTSTMTAPPPAHGAFDMADGQDQAPQVAGAQLDLLGRPVQKLVQLIKELEQLGVETTNLPLPKIVVVGDQSAGKSSLIEGISGIKVPRSDGTCTRCPLQITLYSSSEPDAAAWSCAVSLQQKFSFDPEAIIDGRERYGKWRENHTPATIPFAIVNDKNDLENILSRAQRATLNPGDNPLNYLNNAISVEKMPMLVEFSPNKIILDITAPGQPSLSFIDLPGVVQQMTTAKDKWLVNLVENFVIDHINQGNSLILLARSMESDFANSSGAKLIDECGALARTVGCLTKPDRWPPGSRAQHIKNVLHGDAFAVGHGYFVTKQPNQLELNNNISADDARSSEDQFFTQAPWSTELQDFQERFGTFKLRDFLSIKLTNQILVTLPKIVRTVDAHLQEVETLLAGYPDPPENALGKVLEALTTFRVAVEKHAQGAYPYNEMHNSLKGLANTFHSNLQKLRPGLIVATPEEFRQAVETPTFSLLSDDDAIGTPCPSIEPRSQKKRRADFDTPTTSTAKKIKSDIATPRNSSNPMTKRKTFRLLEVRDTLNKLTASSVPGEVDPVAVDHLRKQTLVGWEQPMLEFVNSVHQEIQNTLDHLLEEACAQWLNTAFFTEARKIVKAFVANTIRDQLQQAKRALDREQRKPLTLNTEGFKYHHDKELQILLEGRATQRLVEKTEDADRAAGKIMVDQSERKKRAKADNKARGELSDDPFAEEIKVMAKVRGYHNVALSRFLDVVVQGVQAEVLHELETNLLSQLKVGLEVETRDAQDRCKELLAEDREREIRRKELQQERSNFIEAQRKLAAIGQIGEDVASLSDN